MNNVSKVFFYSLFTFILKKNIVQYTVTLLVCNSNIVELIRFETDT